MSLAKLTSVSTQTLSLLLERQRLLSMNKPPPGSNAQTQQITRNLNQLRMGILALEEEQETSSQQAGKKETQEACRLLRSQFERMRGMLGEEADGVEAIPALAKHDSSVPATSSLTPPKSQTAYTNPFVPYSDEPPPSPEMEPSAMLQQQQMIMEQQDTHLDHLSRSVGRQRDISLQINDEIGVHNGLLEALDSDVDNTGNRLRGARRRLDKFGKGVKGNWSTFTIAGLIFILLILIIIFKT